MPRFAIFFMILLLVTSLKIETSAAQERIENWIALLQRHLEHLSLEIELRSLPEERADRLLRELPGGKASTPHLETIEHLHTIQFYDNNVGWAIDWNGRFHKTTDSGLNWSEKRIVDAPWLARKLDPDAGVFRGMHFSDAEFGLIVGPIGIMQTHDSGETWKRYASPSLLQLPTAVFCDASRTCWIGSTKANALFKWSTDESKAVHHKTPARGAVRALQFVNQKKGWFVTERGEIVGTADGGTTWQMQYVNKKRKFWAIHFVDDNNGWVVGSEASIFRTTDGGKIWQEQTIDLPPNIPRREVRLHAVKFLDSQSGWIAGLHGMIFKTSNGGLEWTNKRFEGLDLNWATIYALDITHGGDAVWAAGNLGNIFVSINDGNFWFPVHGVAKEWYDKTFRLLRSGAQK